MCSPMTIHGAGLPCVGESAGLSSYGRVPGGQSGWCRSNSWPAGNCRTRIESWWFETHFVEEAGVQSEVAIVQDSSDKIEQVAIAREDTPENSRNLQGSVLDDSDTTTPALVSKS